MRFRHVAAAIVLSGAAAALPLNIPISAQIDNGGSSSQQITLGTAPPLTIRLNKGDQLFRQPPPHFTDTHQLPLRLSKRATSPPPDDPTPDPDNRRLSEKSDEELWNSLSWTDTNLVNKCINDWRRSYYERRNRREPPSELEERWQQDCLNLMRREIARREQQALEIRQAYENNRRKKLDDGGGGSQFFSELSSASVADPRKWPGQATAFVKKQVNQFQQQQQQTSKRMGEGEGSWGLVPAAMNALKASAVKPGLVKVPGGI